ncbi:MAG: hypothetical protein LLG37_11095 [Spirochaetia bacterium]|nr:hypothetical protein [Spirochaetia bacterium]
MGRVGFVDHKGCKILRMDFKDCTIEDYRNILTESAAIIRSGPEHFILTMAVSVDDIPIFTNRDVFVEYLAGNKKHVAAAAVASVSGLRKTLMMTMLSLSRREMGVFDKEEDAKEWLVEQNNHKFQITDPELKIENHG